MVLLPILIPGCNSSSPDAIKVYIMSANLGDPAVATELDKVNPHPISQEE